MTELVHRPFEGLPGECDWVALRELVPAATVELTLKDGLPEGVPSVTLATVLPMAWRCAATTARCCSACRTTRPPATSAATSPTLCSAR